MDATQRNRTLEELEASVWSYSDFGSNVVEESQRLRKIPLEELTNENLRLLIGQGIGLEFLVPVAIEHLGANPLTAGDYFPGDLLEMVLTVPQSFWEAHPDWNNELVEIGFEIANIKETIEQNLMPKLEQFQFRGA